MQVVIGTLLLLLLAGGLGAVVWYFVKKERERREAFAAWAATKGWTYKPGKDRGLAKRFRFLDKLRQGSNRYAQDILRGEWKGRQAQAFTYHYETHTTNSKGHPHTHHHYFGVVLVQIERECPELRIHPENFFSRIGPALGFDDIDFESVEFSRAFTVRSEDKRFAWDFCHTGTMEYLLKHRKTAMELEGSTLAVFDGSRLEPHEVEYYLDHVTRLRDLMPDFLFAST